MRLTYDDGPHPVHTPMVLDLLARHGAYATFFVQGQNVARYPGLVARMVREGHAVGNHTYTHPSMPDRTVEERRVEWAATQDAVQAAAGVRPVLWRPPYGATNPLVKEEAFVLFGLHQVLWERDTFDYLNPSPRVVADRVRATPVGAKVLLHDVHAGTVVATALFLSELAPLSF